MEFFQLHHPLNATVLCDRKGCEQVADLVPRWQPRRMRLAVRVHSAESVFLTMILNFQVHQADIVRYLVTSRIQRFEHSDRRAESIRSSRPDGRVFSLISSLGAGGAKI